jgi:hypothetical protein
MAASRAPDSGSPPAARRRSHDFLEDMKEVLANAVTSPHAMQKFEVLIRILNNHDDDTTISCCEIDVLNWEKVRLCHASLCWGQLIEDGQ